MTINRAFEADKSDVGSGAVQGKRIVGDDLDQQAAKSKRALDIPLDTYFADERVHIPQAVSASAICIGLFIE